MASSSSCELSHLTYMRTVSHIIQLDWEAVYEPLRAWLPETIPRLLFWLVVKFGLWMRYFSNANFSFNFNLIFLTLLWCCLASCQTLIPLPVCHTSVGLMLVLFCFIRFFKEVNYRLILRLGAYSHSSRRKQIYVSISLKISVVFFPPSFIFRFFPLWICVNQSPGPGIPSLAGLIWSIYFGAQNTITIKQDFLQ